jgi:TIR domain-containing protein
VILPVTEPAHAVFLSYASQDAEAAQKICEALRAAGIEVFLDQSERRGGDVWAMRQCLAGPWEVLKTSTRPPQPRLLNRREPARALGL